MTNFPTKKLGEVCKISSGGSAPQGKKYFQNGKYPFFRTSDVGLVHLSDGLCGVRDYLNDDGVKKLKLFGKGTILFPKSGASTFLNHRVVMGCDGYVSSHLATITTKESIDYKYLYFFLILVDAKNIAPNSSYPSLKISDLAELEIPLPPLEIQRKIVERIEKLMGKIDEAKKLRKEAMADASSLIPSALNKIFSPHISSLRGKEGKKKGWEEKTIGDLCIINPRADIKNLAKDMEVSFVPMKAIDEKDGIITIHETRKLSEVAKGYTYFANNDVLFAKITPCMENGKSVIARDLKNGIGFGSTEFHVLRTKGEIFPELIHYHLRQKSFRDEAKKKMTGSAGQKRVPKDFIEKTKIPIPPLLEQQKIVKCLDSLSEKIRKIQALQLATDRGLKLLEKSVLKEAFGG